MDRWFRLLMSVTLVVSVLVVVLAFEGATKPRPFSNVVPVTLAPGVTPGPNLDYACPPGNSDLACPENNPYPLNPRFCDSQGDPAVTEQPWVSAARASECPDGTAP